MRNNDGASFLASGNHHDDTLWRTHALLQTTLRTVWSHASSSGCLKHFSSRMRLRPLSKQLQAPGLCGMFAGNVHNQLASPPSSLTPALLTLLAPTPPSSFPPLKTTTSLARSTRTPQIMAEIELGNGLPDVRTTAETNKSLAAAGFEVIDYADLAKSADIPWWDPVDPDSWRLGSERGWDAVLGGVA